MRLRKLDLKDALLMLEWMHDDSVVHNLRTDFSKKTLADCENFILAAQDAQMSLHLAIVDENDEYMGTVSLKNIESGSAEFGITVRKCAMGKGFSYYAMTEILKYGKQELGLNKVYWCVDPDNHRAVRFYDKHSFIRTSAPDEAESYTDEEKNKYIWYKA